MKYLWIGPGVGPETKKVILSKGGKLLSAYVSQKNLIEGLESFNVDMDTLNGPLMNEKMFPVVKKERWSRNGVSHDVNVGYLNLPFFNRIFKEISLKKEIKKWLKDNSSKFVNVIIYNMHSPFLSAAIYLKKHTLNSTITLIVPDLPCYMDLKMGKFKAFLKGLDWKRQKRMCKQIDKYVLYSQCMTDYLSLKDKKWIVMEGSYNPDEIGSPYSLSDGKISVLYSGILDLKYGIPELLDAFEMLDSNFKLILTGSGNGVELIKNRAKNNDRISFLGYLPSRQELLNLQSSCTMLINIRKKNEPSSKYCFPSKLFEYLASGRPVISPYLEGIPDEYRDFLVELKDVTPREICSSIIKVANMSTEEQIDFGHRGRQFVVQEKNKFKQAKKIYDFVNI